MPAASVQLAIVPTAQVRFKLKGGLTGAVRVLCDTGSQVNLITKKCAHIIGLRKRRANLRVCGVNDVHGMRTRGISTVALCNRFNDAVIGSFDIIVVDELPNILPSRPLEWYGDSDQLADPSYHKPAAIDAILGAGVWARIIQSKVKRFSDDLIALDSKIGALVLGDDPCPEPTDITCHAASAKSKDNLLEMIKHLWEIEKDPHEKMMSPDNVWCQQNFASAHTRTESGRYVVTIPLKPGLELGDSRAAALRRFYLLEARLSRDPELAEKYISFMREYEALGHMTPVDLASVIGGALLYYIAHHPVLKKFRVVFDASGLTTNGRSLNDIQFSGPKLQPDIIDIILDFRTGKYGLCADIAKMFRQILIHKDQWNLQRIFWRENKRAPLREYWLKVVTYGMASSSYNSIRALMQCAADHAAEHPIGAEMVENVDDMLASCDTQEEAAIAKADVSNLLLKGGFELTKWVSNSPDIMNDSVDRPELPLSVAESPSILGIKWDYIGDNLTINVKLRQQSTTMTKRELASECARVYDPLLLLSPVMIRAKHFLKEVWRLKIGWDEKIPSELQQQWEEFYQSLEALKDFRIPRWIGTTKGAAYFH